MVCFYGKVKENGHGQALHPTGQSLSMTIFHYHLGGIGGHALAKPRQYIFPRVCIQELVQKWVQQIEHSIN